MLSKPLYEHQPVHHQYKEVLNTPKKMKTTHSQMYIYVHVYQIFHFFENQSICTMGKVLTKMLCYILYMYYCSIVKPIP
jgi:hypothetical protein